MTLNCLGRVNVAAPGTPVALTTDLNATAAILFIQTIPGLTSKIYIGTKGMNKTTLSGVCRILWPNSSGGISDQFLVSAESGSDQIHPSAYYIDSDVAGEGVLASYWTA
jgi:hypothetical protein